MTSTTGTGARRVWTSILVAVAVFSALCILAVIGLGVYVAHRYTVTSILPPQDARFEFDAALAGVAARDPLVEIEDAEIVVHRTPDRPRREIAALHVLAYEPLAKKLVNVTVPGWVLRIAARGRGRLKISETEVVRRLDGQLNLGDLEQHGPGLVLDTIDLNGRRVLVWTE